MKILAIQANSDGRPCAWGLVAIEPGSKRNEKKMAKEEAARQWEKHACYPGERKGELLLHCLEDINED